MRDFGSLIKDKNFVLRLSELVVTIVGIVFHHRYGNLFIVWGMFGGFFIAVAFVVSYLFEEPNVWTEVLLLVVYTVIMLAAACTSLNADCILPFVAAILMVLDIIFLILDKRN